MEKSLLSGSRSTHPCVFPRQGLHGGNVEPFFPSPHPTQLAFARGAYAHLYLSFASRLLIQSGAGIFHAETYISTQPAQALEKARVPDSDEDQERSSSAVASPGQGTQTRLGETGFPRVVFPTQSSCQWLVPSRKKIRD